MLNALIFDLDGTLLDSMHAGRISSTNFCWIRGSRRPQISSISPRR